MKVMLIGTDASMSGAGLSMIALADNLKTLGLDVVIVVKPGNTEKILSAQGTDHYTVNCQSWMYSMKAPKVKKLIVGYIKRALNIPAFFRYKELIRKENPDIVHINAGTTGCAGAAAIQCRKKIVWHIRELMEEDLGSSFANPEYSKRMMSRADCMIAISEAVAQKFQRVFPNNKIYTVYNGIDLSMYENRTHIIFQNEKVIITIAGRINANKGQAETLRAVSNVLKKQNAELWIAGTGSDAVISQLHEIMEEYQIPAEKVKFLGYVENMPEIWRQTDVAVIASKCEAFGRTTVEAMASGCLVVGADTGGTAELVSDMKTGILYRQGNEKSLEQKMVYALMNKEKMIKIADNGRSFACSNFSAQKNAEEIMKIYTELTCKK